MFVCAGGDIASAYRLAGGHAYPIRLKSRLRFDAAHACSCAACSHCFELSIIIFCGVCTLGVFALVRDSKEMKKEREQVRSHACSARGGLGSSCQDCGTSRLKDLSSA